MDGAADVVIQQHTPNYRFDILDNKWRSQQQFPLLVAPQSFLFWINMFTYVKMMMQSRKYATVDTSGVFCRMATQHSPH